MAHLEPPQPKQGWLDKRGDMGLKQWSRRWFTLDETGLQYYVDREMKFSKGNISLQSITNATSSAPPASELLVASAGAYFQINTNDSKNNRIYYLYCDSKEDTTHWIIAINYWRDYASNSGFGPKSNDDGKQIPLSPPQPQSQQNPLQLPKPFTPYHDPSIPSAPPAAESPYQTYLEYERFNKPSTTNNNTSPPLAHGTTHAHPTFTNNLPPYAPSTQLSVPVPPQPPRPLRTIDENACREILFTEGVNLKIYMDLHVACCTYLMQQDLVIVGNGNEKRMHTLCAYLVLASLDWDNRNTPSTPYWCAQAYEQDPLFQYFTYLVALARQEILDNWPMEGPTVVTQIDTWIKRKRKDHQALIQKEDRDAFIKRNLVILSYIRAGRLFNENSNALDACLVLIDRFLAADENLPHFRYGATVWQAVGGKVADNEKPLVKQLLWAYLVFQKLKLENDQIGFISRDPFVTNAFTTVLTMFHQAISVPSLAVVMRDVQQVMMQIFSMWQRDLPLLNTTILRGDAIQLTQANLRIICRIMVKLMAFPQLYEAFQKLKTTVEQRIGQDAVPVQGSTPFPTLNQQNNVSSEEMTELGYIVRQAINNMQQPK